MVITFRFRYPISRTMAFEREYHPNLRLTLPEKRRSLKNAITIWMFDRGKLVGARALPCLATPFRRGSQHDLRLSQRFIVSCSRSGVLNLPIRTI